MRSASDPIIYVVDDNQDIREAIKNVLESVSLTVEAFRSAEDFLSRRRGDEIACLILDIRCPARAALNFKRRWHDRATNCQSFLFRATATSGCPCRQSKVEQ